MAIAKIRNDGKIPYSESIFRYINSINNYENVTLNFTNDRILTLPDVETITNEERSAEDSLYLTDKKLLDYLLVRWSILLQLPKKHTHICANTRGTKTDNGNLKDAPLGLRQFLATESL